MKIVLGVLVSLGVAFLGMSPAQAQEDWRIEEFVSEIAVQSDGVVAVEETMVVDFGEVQKHGIFRDLPVVYEDGSGDRTYTDVREVAVQQDDQAAVVEVSRNGANLRIRIGDPNRTISGRHQYVIRYAVAGVLQSFEGFDELSWNVTGNGWGVPIEQARAVVAVPAEILQAACYQGAVGARQACDNLERLEGAVRAEAAGLTAGEGLTVAVGYEPGVVPVLVVEAPPSVADVLFDPLTWATAVVVFGLVVVFVARRWWKYGRDRYWQRAHLPGISSERREEHLPEKILPVGRWQSVSVEYDPPDGLRPAEIGVLMDEKADTLDVTATIVDLAARSFLTIEEVPKAWIFGKKDYVFTRTGMFGKKLLGFEQELLEKLFDGERQVALSDLKNAFYKQLAAVKKSLYAEVTKKKLFARRPDSVRMAAVGLAVAAVVVGIGLTIAGANWLWPPMFGSGLGLTAGSVVALMWAPFMPRKTALGRELYERARGYELFVSGTEKYRAKWMENVGLFERVLPYAIMFGVTDQLAKAFEELGLEPPQPTWYTGATTFHMAHFTDSMTDLSSSLSSAMASRPGGSGSGGGGSSGGGFGGGGGGSW